MKQGLSVAMRRQVCIHEAAHGYLFALGGAYVYSLQVAPVGAKRWSARNRKGGSIGDLWGLADVSNLNTQACLYWDKDKCRLVVKRDEYQALLAELDGVRPGYSKTAYKTLRSALCGYIAGDIAEAISEGTPEEQIKLCARIPNDDIAISKAIAELLPDSNEFETLANAVEKLLRSPQIWSQIVRIADALEERHILTEDELFELLPNRDPEWLSEQCACIT
ncbi:MAG: hypothetical protein ACM3X0_11365 [Bacteroidota bacterium]